MKLTPERLIAIRQRNDMRQIDLAVYLGINRDKISRYERGASSEFIMTYQQHEKMQKLLK